MRIVVAMSGGVDSSVAAGLLKERGHEVVGLAMKTHAGEPRGSRACCTPRDMRDARDVADVLDIPFYVLDYAEVFAREVIAPFVAAYAAGRTPNPCVACNDKVKFEPLLAHAKRLGADRLATGHYARIVGRRGQRALARAVHAHKDQSYFLYRLRPDQLDDVEFVLGNQHKDEVRAHAKRLGLPVDDKAESQEICFVGREGYAATVDRLSAAPPAPGPIVDGRGRVLGTHPGVHHFTVGQRRGLGVSAPKPLYVVALDAAARRVVVGPRADLLAQAVTVDSVVWHATRLPRPGDAVLLQARYRQVPQPARVVAVTPTSPNVVGGIASLQLVHAQPQPRAAAGQAAVIYGGAGGDVVLGGGTVAAPSSDSTWSASATPVQGGMSASAAEVSARSRRLHIIAPSDPA